MTMYSMLVHNQKTMTVIGTLCIEADSAAEAMRIGKEVVHSHQTFGILNAKAVVMPALDASQIKHLDWLDASNAVAASEVRGQFKSNRLRRLHAPQSTTQARAWWPQLKGWWAGRYSQFDHLEHEAKETTWAGLR